MSLDYLSWEAFATLVAGGGAVLGAWAIGKRQVAIQERQADIQNGIVRLEELKLKQALFDDRYDVYDQVRRYLSYIMAHAVVPGMTQTENADLQRSERELQNEFGEAVDRSRFLFRPEVREQLLEIWRLAATLHYHKASQRPRGADFAHHVEKEHETHKSLLSFHEDLSRVFGDELLLSADAQRWDSSPTPTANELMPNDKARRAEK